MTKKTKKEMVELGSNTAKNGFKNETYVVSEFNDWQNSDYAQQWLSAMDYSLDEIECVTAEKIRGSYKADIQVSIVISIKLKKVEDIQNLQVKLVSNPKGFNQIDKRWLSKYKELWNIPEDVYEALEYFTGMKKPYKKSRDTRRMFIDELSIQEQCTILNFLEENRFLITTDILKGRGRLAAEWMLVILKLNKGPEIKWALKPMNEVLNHFNTGEIHISPRGSIKIGKITMQRKGGDGGRESANMLQFKINPAEIIKE